MQRKRIHQLITVFLLSFSLIGCKWLFYRPGIQQGNIISETQIAQLKKGMSPREVKNILGNPVVVQKSLEDDTSESADLLDSEVDIMKIEYIYFHQPGYGQPTRKRLTLSFEDEKLIASHLST